MRLGLPFWIGLAIALLLCASADAVQTGWRFYMSSGSGESGLTVTWEEFNPNTDQWTTGTWNLISTNQTQWRDRGTAYQLRIVSIVQPGTGKVFTSENLGPWNYYGGTIEIPIVEYVEPEPTPVPGEVEIELTGAQSGWAGIYIDLDGDGVKERVGEFFIDSNGQGDFEMLPEWEGKEYEIIVDRLFVDGDELPVNISLGGGAFGGEPTHIEETVELIDSGQTGGVTIDENGNLLTTGGVTTTTTTTGGGGPVTSYVYNDSGGGTNVINYNDNAGAEAAKTGDIRMAAAQNSAENAKIVEAIGDGSDTVAGAVEGVGDELGDALAGIQSAIEEGNEEPEGPGSGEITDEILGDLDTTPDVEAPNNYSASVPGGSGTSEFWSVDILEYTLNFDPRSNPIVVTLFNWIHAFITIVVTIYFGQALAKMTWEAQVAVASAPQTLSPRVDIAGTSFGTLGGVAYVALIIGSIIAATTIWSFYVNAISPLVSPQSSGNAVRNLFTGVGGPFGEAIDLLLAFVPVAHIITCVVNYLLALTFRGAIYMTYQAIRKAFVA